MPIPNGFVPVESQTITDHTYQHLRAAIHVGQLKPGQRLIDTELAEALQVSRATVREALRMLESRGLIVIRHRKGAFVAELTPDDLRDACNFRSLLETHAVRLGAHDATAGELTALQQLIDDLRIAATRQDFEQIVDLDLRFHFAICHFARSKRLLETWRGMETMLRAFLLLKYALYDDSALIAESHQPIVDALREHDAARAGAALSAHIGDTAEHVLERMEHERHDAVTRQP